MRPIKSGREQENKLDQHFREKLRNMEATPPPPSWDRLEAGLDQERATIKYDHWYYVLLVLLLPFTTVNLVMNYDLQDYYQEFLSEKQRETNYGPKYWIPAPHPAQVKYFARLDKSTITQPLDMSYVEDVPFEVTFSPSYVKNKISPYIAASEVAPTVMSPKNNSLLAMAGKQKNAGMGSILLEPLFVDVEEVGSEKFGLGAVMLSALDSKGDDPLPVYKKKMYRGSISKNYVMSLPKVKGFYFGIDASGHQNRLFLKEDAFYPLIDKDVVFTFKWGYSYGMSMGYNFSQRFGIETELILNSVQGMSYADNLYGKIRREGNIQLNYMHLPVMAKYKWSKVSTVTGYPVSLNLVGGVMYSRLREVQMSINGEQLSAPQELFAKHELGMLLGLEYDVYISKSFFFTVGTRASVTTDVKQLGTQANVYNLLLGVNASFNYQLPQLKKKNTEKPVDIE